MYRSLGLCDFKPWVGGGSVIGNLYFGSLGLIELCEERISWNEYQSFCLDSFPVISGLSGCGWLTWQWEKIFGLLVTGFSKVFLGSHLTSLKTSLVASLITMVLMFELAGFGVTDLESWKCCLNCFSASRLYSCYLGGLSAWTSVWF